MEVTESFKEFLKEIRLPDALREEAKDAHEIFRETIESDEVLKPIIVDTFLQGSYRRHTGVKPAPGKKADVDIVVVTSIDRNTTNAKAALNRFKPFLEKHYKNAYKPNSRSWAISIGEIKLDLVPTSAPSEAVQKFFKEARKSGMSDDFFSYYTREGLKGLQKTAGIENWKDENLWIPDRDSEEWDETNPLAQIAWTADKNANTNEHYVNVVKVVKWWRRLGCAGEYPKGYPLEHLVGQNCPDGISSVAEGFTKTLEQIVINYRDDYRNGKRPHLADHAVPGHNVFEQITPAQFKVFYEAVVQTATLARAALNNQDNDTSIDAWRGIFGELFPEEGHKNTAFAAPTAKASMIKANFA